MSIEPGKIRNVAVVGHRGTGKTSLVEAMLFQSGATNRLGTIEAGTTVGDWDDDEQKRRMSLQAALCHVDWHERKINLLDTPGDAGFMGDAIAALRVVEGALFTVSAVMGVEVQTSRLWQRAQGAGLARVLFVNMLDRERADFFRTLEALRAQLSERCVAVHIPIGSEHEVSGIVDLLHMCAFMDPNGEKESGPGEIPADMAAQVEEYRTKLLDEVVQADEGLMERYLEGEELGVEEVAHALKDAVTRGEVFPVACGVATKNLGTTALLDLLVEGVPSPAKKGEPMEVPNTQTAAFVFKTIADPFAGRINVFRVLHGTIKGDSDAREPALACQGARRRAADAPGQGARVLARVRDGRHRRRGEAEGDGDRRPAARPRGACRDPDDRLPRARDELRGHAEGQGRRGEGRVFAATAFRGGSDAAGAPRPADRRAAPLGPVADARRGRGRAAPEPLQRRGRAPSAARSVPRDDPQRVEGAGPVQEADRRPGPVRRLPHRDRAARGAHGLRVRGQDRRRRDPAELPAGRRQGDPGGDAARRPRGRARAGRARPARGRLVPHRRLVGDGVQDRRLDGLQGRVREGRSRCCSSRSWRSR